MQEKVNITNDLGYSLVGVLHSPDETVEHPAGIILIHGMLKNKNHFLMARAADKLIKSGFTVLNIDLTGHGESGGKLTEATISQWINDIKKLIDFLYSRNVKKVGLLGYSLGGASVLLTSCVDTRINAIVLYAPVGHPDRLSERFNKNIINQMMEQNKTYLKKDASFDAEGYKKWLTDMHQHDVIEKSKLVHQPTLIIHGAIDIVVPAEESKDIYSNLGSDESVKQRVLIRTTGHTFRGFAKKLAKQANKWFIKYLPYESEAVRVWLKHNDRYLFVKRSERMKFFPGKWAPIGGFLEKGNSVKVQSYKEIKEETGISRDQLTLIKSADIPVELIDDVSDKLWKIYHVVIESKTDKVNLNWEAEEYKWIKLDEVEQLDTIPGLIKHMKHFI